MENIKAVILAAGKGTRMKSDLPKVLHKIDDKTLVEYVVDAVKGAGIEKVCLVVGYKADMVKEGINCHVEFALQEEQLGTGHAVKCAADFIGNDGETLILCGDTPLIQSGTIKKLIDFHKKNNNYVTVLSAKIDDPTGYGRIIREENGQFIKNEEHKDATEKERETKEINSGMYIFNSRELVEGLSMLNTDNAQGEYYLPDVITVIKNKGLKADAYVMDNANEIFGINTIEQLEEAKKILKDLR